jgi:hypothetical protein
VVRPKRELTNRTSEEAAFSAGPEAGAVPTLPVSFRAEGSGARHRRWDVTLALISDSQPLGPLKSFARIEGPKSNTPKTGIIGPGLIGGLAAVYSGACPHRIGLCIFPRSATPQAIDFSICSGFRTT